MGFQLRGYLLEKPRVGASNSPFSLTPDNGVLTSSDQTAYDAAFNTSETLPRVEYLTLALVDGSLANAEFGWTKNEDLQRFDWDGANQRFAPLPGAPPVVVTVSLDPVQANIQRLKAAYPAFPLGSYPYRLFVGSTGTGTALVVDLVPDDSSFTTPPATGHVQLSKATGTLNWNTADLATYASQPVYFQRQAPFTFKESKGDLGAIPATGTGTFILNPIPGSGQIPLIRFGFSLWLQAVQVANEGSFGTPDPGSFQWAADTGLLKFNAADIVAHRGANVYNEGILFARGLNLPRQTLGTVTSHGSISNIPRSGGDLLFRATDTISTGTATFPDSGTLQDGSANFSNVAVGDVLILTSGPATGTRRVVRLVLSNTQLRVQPSFPSIAGATYLIERLINQFGETDRFPTIAGAPEAKAGIVQVDDTGAIRFSTPDTVAFGTHNLNVVLGDLPLERGLSMRFFRTPVNTQDTDVTLKDVSTFYPTTHATITNPVIGFPMAFLPILPIDDPAYPMTYRIEQGTGSFVATLLRLDTQSPPDGIGYTLDFKQQQINYAVRKSGIIVPIVRPSGGVVLPDQVVDPDNIVLELDQGSGYVPLVLDQDAVLEPTSAVVSFTNTQGILEVTGRASSFTGSTLTDSTKDFVGEGILQGDFLVIVSGGAEGVYSIASVTTSTLVTNEAALASVTNVSYVIRRSKEIMADRFFQTMSLADPNTKVEKVRPLGVAQNATRYTINPPFIPASRMRIGQTTFSALTQVTNDGAFTSPGSLPSGTVEISLTTGHLNFSAVDVAASTPVFSVLLLKEAKDYRLSPIRGLVQVIERLLTNDELLVSYQPLDDPNNPPATPTPYQQERATFQISKEIGLHPVQGSTVTFNPLGRVVATNPPPAVWRGGRPQTAAQCAIDTTNSILTFQPDDQVTDAIPHGATVQTQERIFIDYFIYSALGGENTTQVLLAPIKFAIVNMNEGDGFFKVPGNHTADFPQDYLLRVERTEIYYLAAPTYDAIADVTTVNLLAPQVIREARQQPKLEVTSGPVRANSLTFFLPSYFTIESNFTTPIPRGMDKFKLSGDISKIYEKGTILYFTDGVTNDFSLCQGSAYDPDTNLSEVTLTNPTARQFTPGQHVFRRSIRAVLESVATTTSTLKTPVLMEGFTLFRKIDGQPGKIVMSVTKGQAPPASPDVSIDDSGTVVFTDQLVPGEEFSIFYTGYTIISQGNVRAAYTAMLVPNDVNGLNNQIFTGDFTAFSPDSFYFRVETMANFQAEVAQQYKDTAKASVPTGGPHTSNSSGTPLYKQGRESVFFNEGHLGNEDVIARATLKFYNDIINLLEDVLQNFDGRVVGDGDGRFKFDGTPGTVRTDFATVENQIDDTFQTSIFPVTFDGSTFVSIGTFQKVYLPAATSRFYKTARNAFGITVKGHNSPAPPDGTQVLDLGTKNLNNVGTIFRRNPRAFITKDAPAGSTSIIVDEVGQAILAPDGVTPLLRPAFQVDERVIIPGFLDDPSTTTVVGISGHTLFLSAGVPVDVPAGSTITLSVTDSFFQTPPGYQRSYRGNYDIGVDPNNGVLTYIDPYFPYDGTAPTLLVPKTQVIQPIDEKVMLQASIAFFNTATAPTKFPGLYGQMLMDGLDQAIPFVNPHLVSEGPLLQKELVFETAVTGTIPLATSGTFTGTGTLDGTKTILTTTSPATFPVPHPEIGDLVRILAGTNANSSFHQIIAVGASTVTVDQAFPLTEVGTCTFLVTAATDIVTGSVTVPTTTTVTDTLVVDYSLLGVQVGHTFVFTSGANVRARRQITAIALNVLTLDHPVTLAGSGTYRIHNPLSTYSGTAGLVTALDAEKASLNGLSSTPNSEKVALDDFFNDVFADVTTPGGVSGTTTAPLLLTAPGTDFQALGVSSQHFVYIEGGTAEGVYSVATVTGAHTLNVSPTTPFPVGVAVTFRIVTAFGVTSKTLTAIAPVRTAIDQFANAIAPFKALLNTQVPVVTAAFPAGDPSMFAVAVTAADITARATAVQTRLTTLTSPAGYITTVQSALTSGDRLYDKRYTWIDARINLQKGILTQISQSIAQRIQAQQDTVNQLIKLLAVG